MRILAALAGALPLCLATQSRLCSVCEAALRFQFALERRIKSLEDCRTYNYAQVRRIADQLDQLGRNQNAADGLLDRVDQTQDDHGTRLDTHDTTLHDMAMSIRRLEADTTDLRHRLALLMLRGSNHAGTSAAACVALEQSPGRNASQRDRSRSLAPRDA